MKRLLFLILAAILLGLTVPAAHMVQAASHERYIVIFHDMVTNVPGAASDMAEVHGLAVGHTYKKVLKGFAAKIPAGKLEALKKDVRVKYIAVDQQVSINPAPPGKGKKPTPTPTPTTAPTPTPTSAPTPTPSPTPTPTPSPLWIRVTSPNGGEILQVGQTYRITWDSSPAIDNMFIGYKSCDSCLDWIAFGVPNTGYFDWTVNVGNTTNTQFRIDVSGYDTGVGSASDLSDAPFTVLQNATPTPTPSPTPSPTPIPTPPAQATPSGIRRVGTPTNTGTGVTVAVLDTGINLTHPDIAGNIIASTSCVGSEPTAEDGHGHGSHVAGTIAAINNAIGVIGMAPDTDIAAVKVLDRNGSGYWSEIICGIDWVTSHATQYNIKVANMSLGGNGTSDNACGTINNDPMHTALCNSAAAGVTYVVAAGNNGNEASLHVPSAYDDTVITVSALADYDGRPGGLYSMGGGGYGPDDTFATFSNYGPIVDIGAPGVNIYSTYKNGGYTTMSGTSMASPHVAGAAALYLSTHPTASWTQVRNALVASGETLGNGHSDPSGRHPEPVLNVVGL